MKRYEKIKLIGKGSFGIVYKAKNVETQEIVAYKVMTKVKHLCFILCMTNSESFYAEIMKWSPKANLIFDSVLLKFFHGRVSKSEETINLCR